MRQGLYRRILKYLEHPLVPVLVALLGGIIYFVQSVYYAHMQMSVLDEGAYLYKGLLFASGKYRPYQDYGPWTNHMPLSFLIPGYVQYWFGPGLRTGRYFAILLGLLVLLALWITARRLGNLWWAAGAVWAIALNPAMIKIYSLAISEGLAAAMLMWVMALSLGKERKMWQLSLGSGLAGVLLLTRLNMSPVLPLLVAYIFWQYGRRAGWTATIVGGLVVVIGHAVFWPGILQMWARWMPASVTPFLAPWRYTGGGSPSWDPQYTLRSRLVALSHGLRFYFLPIVVWAGVVLSVSSLEHGKNTFQRKAYFFVFALFGLLLGIHAWASLGRNSCAFCFTVYPAFFAPLSLLLMPCLIDRASGEKMYSKWAIQLFILLILAIIGWGAYKDIGLWVLSIKLPRVMTFLRTLNYIPGKVSVGVILESKLNLSNRISSQLLSVFAGLFMGGIIIFLAWLTTRFWKKREEVSFSGLSLIMALIFGLVLSPTVAFGGGFQDYDCSGDLLTSNEVVGVYLSSQIPSGSMIYWSGGLSAVPLLYIPDVETYLPQINNGFSFRHGGETDSLLKYGSWNEVLETQWKHEADFILIEESKYNDAWEEFFSKEQLDELSSTPSTAPCREDARIRIFRRKQE
jgi:hypothetical protein